MTKLVEITAAEHGVEIDMRYATTNNVTGKPFYATGKAYLHPEAEAALRKAVELAKAIGFGITIFDAYRPLEAQQFLWDHCPIAGFVSNPETGSIPHCRGVAVDLTLTRDGKELDMGTGFDDFTEQSHHARTDVSQEAQANRFTLMGIMTAAGWDFYRNEWWHYQLFNARSYEALSDKDAGTGLIA